MHARNLDFDDKLPIEIGRWYRKKREERICPHCMVLGDEKHYLFECPTIDRDGLDIGNNMEHFWNKPDVFKIMKQLIYKEHFVIR